MRFDILKKRRDLKLKKQIQTECRLSEEEENCSIHPSPSGDIPIKTLGKHLGRACTLLKGCAKFKGEGLQLSMNRNAGTYITCMRGSVKHRESTAA